LFVIHYIVYGMLRSTWIILKVSVFGRLLRMQSMDSIPSNSLRAEPVRVNKLAIS